MITSNFCGKGNFKASPDSREFSRHLPQGQNVRALPPNGQTFCKFGHAITSEKTFITA